MDVSVTKPLYGHVTLYKVKGIYGKSVHTICLWSTSWCCTGQRDSGDSKDIYEHLAQPFPTLEVWFSPAWIETLRSPCTLLIFFLACSLAVWGGKIKCHQHSCHIPNLVAMHLQHSGTWIKDTACPEICLVLNWWREWLIRIVHLLAILKQL